MDVDRDRLWDHVQRLAREPRPAQSTELLAAREYVTEHLQAAGWNVDPFDFAALDAISESGANLNGRNLIARHPADPSRGAPRFCVGAHLDSLPETPGADDNASAVAALLEIARLMPASWPVASQLELELVVFDLEEWGMLGGTAHAELCRSGSADLTGMVSLEMLGYCDHRPHTQTLPRSLKGKYPHTGNFIAAIGNQISGPLLRTFCDGMREAPDLPVETLLVSENGLNLQATRLSDHSPFWDAGFPALMITDTSFLRNPHYHTPADRPETLDLDFLHRVARGCLAGTRCVLEGRGVCEQAI